MTEVDNLSNFAEVEIFVALDEHNLLLSCRKNLGKLGFEISLVERVIVDLIRWRRGTVRQHLHYDRPVILRLIVMLLGRLRNQRLQASRCHRHDDHEDDQQHEKNVDKRGYVDLRNRSACISSTHSHSNLLKILLLLHRYESASCQIVLSCYFFAGVVFVPLSSTRSVSKPSWLTPAERIPSTASITLP